MCEHSDDEFWRWVAGHAADSPERLWLKYGRMHASEIVQVECRRRFSRKLADTLARVPHWLFPSTLAGEQSTSDRLAAFHARLVPDGAVMADLTAGLGIDTLHCAAVARNVTSIEIDAVKADALRHNMAAAGIGNVSVVAADCREWLEQYDGARLDMVFIDPARRSADGGRVFALADCEPDVVAMLPQLRRKARRMLVKMSPMLDISSVLGVLPECARLFVLGTATECKELLALVDFENEISGDIEIEAVTLAADAEYTFDHTRAEEMEAEVEYGLPSAGDYVCEPYPAVMKTGAVRVLAQRYGLQKLAPNTHVYFASSSVCGFPGEQRRVVGVLPWASKVLKRFRRDYPRISVAARNFGISAEVLRAKLGVADSNEYRLLAVTDVAGEKHLIVLRNGREL